MSENKETEQKVREDTISLHQKVLTLFACREFDWNAIQEFHPEHKEYPRASLPSPTSFRSMKQWWDRVSEFYGLPLARIAIDVAGGLSTIPNLKSHKIGIDLFLLTGSPSLRRYIPHFTYWSVFVFQCLLEGGEMLELIKRTQLATPQLLAYGIRDLRTWLLTGNFRSNASVSVPEEIDLDYGEEPNSVVLTVKSKEGLSVVDHLSGLLARSSLPVQITRSDGNVFVFQF